MRNLNTTILSGDDSASVNGSQMDANQMLAASFQAIFGDNTAAGTVKIQMSNDPTGGPRGNFTVVNWSDIPSATSTVTAGVAAPILLSNMAYGWIRAVYTRSGGGSTTVTVNMTALSQ